MVSRILAILATFGVALLLLPLLTGVEGFGELSDLAAAYVTMAPKEVGAQNLVTAVIVTLRGLDTLGEVAVLFIAATAVGFLMSGSGRNGEKEEEQSVPDRGPSEILQTGSALLFPLLLLFGVFVFVHGHLTPGGGFQGGVIIASGLVLLRLGRGAFPASHSTLGTVEAFSGAFYVALGILGLILAGGFLDSRVFPLGEFGSLLSAGTIPVIYALIGLKVGSELTSILTLLDERKEHP
jgi:multicomponent Na+:H+ antiporter subunit B